MPRRLALSVSERTALLALPDESSELYKCYTLSEHDLSIIHQRRGRSNRLGFAVLLSYMRYPGIILGINEKPDNRVLEIIADQLNISDQEWSHYGERAETRREHLLELQLQFGFSIFSAEDYKKNLEELINIALRNDKGIVIATQLVDTLRKRKVLLPTLPIIDRICSEAITRANRQIYRALSDPLNDKQKKQLDLFLKANKDSSITTMLWLQQSPSSPNAKHMLEHLERLKTVDTLEIPSNIHELVHQNRLLKIAREGRQMTPSDLAKFETDRRYATLVAIVLESKATIIDEIIDLHDRIMGRIFNLARHAHEEQFQKSGKAINDKVRLLYTIGSALIEARNNCTDPFSAIESIIEWSQFEQKVIEAHDLAPSKTFDYLSKVGNYYTQIRRYTPVFLKALIFKATPARQSLLDALNILRELNETDTKIVPDLAPVDFVTKRWKSLVLEEDGINRRYYELCVLSELRNGLRSGDIYVQHSRQFKDFDEYLLSNEKYHLLEHSETLNLKINTKCDTYLHERISLLGHRLQEVNKMALTGQLFDVTVNDNGLKVKPLSSTIPKEAQTFVQQAYGMLPHIKITDLLLEVDEWTGFSKRFTHLKSGDTAKDRMLLLSAILANGINLGLTKMAESSHGTTYAKLARLQAWHIRDETYSDALAQLINMQSDCDIAKYWGDGTTSSSDGQRFKTSGHAQKSGNINPKYGGEPGVQVYTHISDQYAPFHSKIINVGVRDSTYVLDGLLYHESDLKIEEHYTDTAGFTDHVFALTHILGFKFAPRIRDLGDKKLYIPSKQLDLTTLSSMIGGTIDQKRIRAHWDEILRLSASIQHGTVSASLIMRKLASYPRQNGLATALREFGKIERTLFTLEWLQDVELRRRVNAGLNKGEARNALARAVFFNRLGDMRDRNFEQQKYRASGLNLITAAIVLWNTVYLERTITALRDQGYSVDDDLLQYLSPLGWEHINLTGDYTWKENRKVQKGQFRPLRVFKKA
jgi:TnpA family transposase